MTADDGHDHDQASRPEAVTEPDDQPKTPIWRPAGERERSTLAVAIILVGIAAVGILLGTLQLEGDFFSGPATETPVTIIAIESVSDADAYTTRSVTYRVSLADGTQATLASPRTHKSGTRLVAMVSRGRITGRIFVTSPYRVLPDE